MVLMAISRKDPKGRKLREGENWRNDGRYSYRYTDVRTGKRLTVYAQDLPELREKEKQIAKDMEDNILTDGAIKKMTLNTLFERYMETRELADTTRVSYVRAWENRVKDEIGNIKVVQLLPSHIKAYYAKLSKAGYAYSTIKYIHNLLYPALEMAVDDDIIRKNPAKSSISDYGKTAEEKEALTVSQQEKFMEFVKQSNVYNTYYPMFTIMIGTGLRCGELIGLTWKDINKALADRFVSFMEKNGYMVTSINKYIICFKAMIQNAMDQELHNNLIALRAFSKKKIQETDKAKEIYLTKTELQALYEMPLEGLKDKVRDVFLVGCYTCQRFSDYARLEKENFTKTAKGTKVVRIVQEKTGNDVVIPILNDNLLHIAEKYGYDIPKVNDVILNRYIKQILKELSSTVPSLARKERTLLTMKEREKEKQGLVSFERDNKGYVIKPRYELVSSHTARRSGITNLYLSGNFDTYQMMSISGHRDEKTFYEYIKLSSDEVADSIAQKKEEHKNELF